MVVYVCVGAVRLTSHTSKKQYENLQKSKLVLRLAAE